MNKKKLQAAIAPFPIKQSDKERFVNTITEMSSNGGGSSIKEYYYKVIENKENPTPSQVIYESVARMGMFITLIYECYKGNKLVCVEGFSNEFSAKIKAIKIYDIPITFIDFNDRDHADTSNFYMSIYQSGSLYERIERQADAFGFDQIMKQELLDMFFNLFQEITKEEYESMIGQEATA